MVVDEDVLLGPEGPGDDRPLGMLLGFLGRELPGSHELVDERVVARALLELAVAQAIQARVADVCDRQLALAQPGGRQRRAHSGQLLVGARQPVHALVGLGDEAREALLGGARPVGQAVVKGLDRGPRRDLAGLSATHAVGDDEQGRRCEGRVLVAAPLTAGVGTLEVIGDAQHRASRGR